MSRRKMLALFTALCVTLMGCNTNTPGPDDPLLTTEETSQTTAVTPELTDDTEPADTDTTDETSDTSDVSDISDSSEDSQTVTSTTENTTASTTSSRPVTAPPPVTTTTTTTTTTTQTTAPPPPPAEPSEPTIYANTADGTLTIANSKAIIDYSNADDGYIMAKYLGTVSKVKVQITDPKGVTQTYNLSGGNYNAYPLTGGNGKYSILVAENISGNSYAQAAAGTIDVNISNSLSPFLRPSRIVDYAYGDPAVNKASQLCGGTSNALEKVYRVYTWLVDNVVYDKALAQQVTSGQLSGGYEPDIDKVINSQKGICYDYAGAMTAMLRSQNVPTQLIAGYAGSTYHAWVNVYVKDVGWVYNVIYFDGSSWHRMDPTFAASSKSDPSIMQYIGDGSNYTTKYVY